MSEIPSVIYGNLAKIASERGLMKFYVTNNIPFEKKVYAFNTWNKGIRRNVRRLEGKDVSIIIVKVVFLRLKQF